MPEIDDLLARIVSEYILDKSAEKSYFHLLHFLLNNFEVQNIEHSEVRHDLREEDAIADDLTVEKAVCDGDVTICEVTSQKIRFK